LRIALVSDCYWPRVNGVTVSVQTYRDELQRLGHEVLILCPEYPVARGAVAKECSVRRFPSMASAVSREDRLIRPSAFPVFVASLERFNPDVIHINTEFSAYFAARGYAKLRGYPLLITSHTDYEDYVSNYITYLPPAFLKAVVRFLMRAVFRTADVIITPSRTQEQKLKAYHIRKHFIVIPTGISGGFVPQGKEEVAAYRAGLDARFPALAGKRILLFAGRITIEKDVKFLVPVLRRILYCREDAILLFAGDGPGRAQVEVAARRSGLADRCFFLGYVPRSELPLVYAAADVFVFPSKTETQGLCTIEAMATGLPVVAIGEMGTRDVMRGDHGGFMVGDDKREFSEAVLRLLEDDRLRASKSREAIAWARQYRVETTTLRLERLYKVLAARHSRQLMLRSGIG
jgi:1,2-diacylglycerol 3-alpha-glucosyltransferase